MDLSSFERAAADLAHSLRASSSTPADPAMVVAQLSHHFPVVSNPQIQSLVQGLQQEGPVKFFDPKKLPFTKKFLKGVVSLCEKVAETEKAQDLRESPGKKEGEEKEKEKEEIPEPSELSHVNSEDFERSTSTLAGLIFFNLVQSLLRENLDDVTEFLQGFDVDLGFVKAPEHDQTEASQIPENSGPSLENEEIWAEEDPDDFEYEPLEAAPVIAKSALASKAINPEKSWKLVEHKISDLASLAPSCLASMKPKWSDPSFLALFRNTIRCASQHKDMNLGSLIKSYVSLLQDTILDSPSTMGPLLFPVFIQAMIEASPLSGVDKRGILLSAFEGLLSLADLTGRRSLLPQLIQEQLKAAAPLIVEGLEEAITETRASNMEIHPEFSSLVESAARIGGALLEVSNNTDEVAKMLIETGLFKGLFLFSLRVADKQSRIRTIFDFLTFGSSRSKELTQFLASSPPFVALMNAPHFVNNYWTHRVALCLQLSADPFPNIDRKQLFQSTSKQFSEKIAEQSVGSSFTKGAWTPQAKHHFQGVVELLRFIALWRDTASGRTFFGRESTIKKALATFQTEVKKQLVLLDSELQTSDGAARAEGEGISEEEQPRKLQQSQKGLLNQLSQQLKLTLIEVDSKKD